MNVLSDKERSQVVALLCEGMSLRSVTRITGIHRTTVMRLLVRLGRACERYRHERFVNLPCVRLQADEVWAFVYCKRKRVTTAKAAPKGAGDSWSWTCICRDTKLMVAWYVGDRSMNGASLVMHDAAYRLATDAPEISTDQFVAYAPAVWTAFGGKANYGQIRKIYGSAVEQEKRYSPAQLMGVEKRVLSGTLEKRDITTSHVEASNLHTRMGCRRYTRLTNAHSKKFSNHVAATNVQFMHYNLCRIHHALRCTPAMQAGVEDHIWTHQEFVKLLELYP